MGKLHTLGQQTNDMTEMESVEQKQNNSTRQNKQKHIHMPGTNAAVWKGQSVTTNEWNDNDHSTPKQFCFLTIIKTRKFVI